jgi:hypothetical protein
VLDSETIAKGEVVSDDEALLVTATPNSGNPSLLWRGRLFELRQPIADRLAQGVPVALVAQEFLDEIPKGQPIEPISVPDSGAKSNLDPSWKVGEVITVFGVTSEDRYVLVRQDGLFYVTQLEAQVAAFNGRRMNIGELTDNGRRTIGSDLLPKAPSDLGQPPSNVPRFLTATGSTLCSVQADADGRKPTLIDVPLPR